MTPNASMELTDCRSKYSISSAAELLGKDTAGEKYEKGGYKEAAFPE